MALRDQPYIPLYVKDILTDEKLALCSAEAIGVYLFILCLLHKQETYGCLLLKDRHKKTSNLDSFSAILAKQMPFEFNTVKRSLAELIEEKVLSVEGDALIQKRMVKDNQLSEIRAESARKKGKSTFCTSKSGSKTPSKIGANTEYANANEIEVKEGGTGETVELKKTPGWNQKPGPEAHGLELPEIKAGAAQQWFLHAKGRTLNLGQVAGLWNVFKVVNLTGGKFYNSVEDVYSHFLNWIRFQDADQIKPAATTNHVSETERQNLQMLKDLQDGKI